MTEPKAPKGLGPAGRELWRAVTGRYDLAAHEAVALGVVCRQADLVRQLEEAVAADGLVVAGAAGQPRLNGAVTELRQSRLALSRLLADLRLPDEEARADTPARARARHAAESRWSNVRGRRLRANQTVRDEEPA